MLKLNHKVAISQESRSSSAHLLVAWLSADVDVGFLGADAFELRRVLWLYVLQYFLFLGVKAQPCCACFVYTVSIVFQSISFKFFSLCPLQGSQRLQIFPFLGPLSKARCLLVHDLTLLEYGGLGRLIRRSWRHDGPLLPVKVLFPDVFTLGLGNLGTCLLHLDVLAKVQ